MRFTKMHGIGNDYVYLDAVTDPSIERRPDLPRLARAISDRHRGVGSDGLILVCRPRGKGRASGHVRMRMFNADGSESEMCGNGVRCVAKFAHDRLGVTARPMRVETGRGVLSIAHKTDRAGKLARATVDMGRPILTLRRIPVDARHLAFKGVMNHFGFEVSETCWIGAFVSMGNPHVVLFDAENRQIRDAGGLRRLDLPRVGPAIERHRAFPNRVNAHFVEVHSRGEATMRTWERGAGATLACGTGACAVCVAGVRTGRLNRKVRLHLPGGDLDVAWELRTGRVFMTGPARDVFEGEWPG
jgi:diaminopimelate epimerase